MMRLSRNELLFIALGAVLGTIVAWAVRAGLVAAPLAAQGHVYARSMNNDLGQCAQGRGPAVRIVVSGLKSSEGNLFVRAYPANSRDWLESKRYVMRVDARPQKGSMTVCLRGYLAMSARIASTTTI